MPKSVFTTVQGPGKLQYQPRSLDVVVLRGNWWNPMGAVIYTRTGTLWTHCVTVRGSDGNIYDAHTPGVELRNLNNYSGRFAAVLRRRDIDDIPLKDKIAMIQWADDLVKAQNGYDFKALVGFLCGIKCFEDDSRWYCAELPYWMWEYHGYPIMNEEVTFIYPSDHYRCRAYKLITTGII